MFENKSHFKRICVTLVTFIPTFLLSTCKEGIETVYFFTFTVDISGKDRPEIRKNI